MKYEYSITGNYGGCAMEPTGSNVLTSRKTAQQVLEENWPDGGCTLWRRIPGGGWEIIKRVPDKK